MAENVAVRRLLHFGLRQNSCRKGIRIRDKSARLRTMQQDGCGLTFSELTDGNGHPNGWPCRMLITSQSEARRFAHELAPTHVLSIKSDRTRYFGPTGLPEGQHLMMVFNDTTDVADNDPPTHAHFDRIQAWMEQLPTDARLLVHCLQGVHRSCAIGLGFLVQQVPPLRAAYLLHTVRPYANPNRLMARLWDERLGLKGELLKVVEHFPCDVWRHGDGLGTLPHRRAKPAKSPAS